MGKNTHVINPTFQNIKPIEGDTPGAGSIAENWRRGYDQSKRRPECRKGSVPPDDDWEGAQQMFSSADRMDAWFFQRISVGKENKGKVFVFGARVALKSVNQGSGIGEYYVSLGIDRLGEENPSWKTANWMTPQHQNYVPKWTDFEIRATIEGEWVTVFIRSYNNYRVDGSLFVKSCYGYIEDTTQPQPEPPDEPDNDVLTTISEQLSVIQQNQIVIKSELDKTLKRGDVL